MSAPRTFGILAEGSVGDLIPYLQIARELRSRGHRVLFASHSDYQAAVAEVSDEFVALNANPVETMLQSDAVSHRPLAARSLFRRMLHVRRHFRPSAAYLAQVLGVCRRVDAAAYHALVPATADACESLGKPAVAALHSPLRMTGDFAGPVGPLGLHRRSWGSLVHRGVHAAMLAHGWWMCGEWLNEWRTRTLGLRPLRAPFERSANAAESFLYSPLVLPKPRDWPTTSHVTGFCLPPEVRRMPIAATRPASPAVYVYFGSNGYLTAAFMEMCIESITAAGARALVSDRTVQQCPGDWTRRCTAVENARFIEALGHVSALMHHSGAGTCAVALHAGLPAICVPFFADQRFWAGHMEQIGVAPRTRPFNQLTREQLTAQVRAVLTQEAFRTRALGLANRLRQEDGPARAADVLESIVPPRARSSGSNLDI